jgi:hypothetical protein
MTHTDPLRSQPLSRWHPSPSPSRKGRGNEYFSPPLAGGVGVGVGARDRVSAYRYSSVMTSKP